ncbi:reverse transcriptase domain-containing protein [Tanacetum coccineum]
MQEALGTRLDMSTANHPQTDGQSERTIQNLEDILGACVLDFGGSWEKVSFANFVEELAEILERVFKKLKRSTIAIVKVRWNLKRGLKFTWEG